jgi:ABC-type glycerol-3-phosphate transport system permease component
MLVLLFTAINCDSFAAEVHSERARDELAQSEPRGVLLRVLLTIAGALCLFPFFWTLVMATNTPRTSTGTAVDDAVGRTGRGRHAGRLWVPRGLAARGVAVVFARQFTKGATEDAIKG